MTFIPSLTALLLLLSAGPRSIAQELPASAVPVMRAVGDFCTFVFSSGFDFKLADENIEDFPLFDATLLGLQQVALSGKLGSVSLEGIAGLVIRANDDTTTVSVGELIDAITNIMREYPMTTVSCKPPYYPFSYHGGTKPLYSALFDVCDFLFVKSRFNMNLIQQHFSRQMSLDAAMRALIDQAVSYLKTLGIASPDRAPMELLLSQHNMEMDIVALRNAFFALLTGYPAPSAQMNCWQIPGNEGSLPNLIFG